MTACLMSVLGEAILNPAQLHQWERRLLIQRVADAMYVLKEHALSEGAFDDTPELDRFLYRTSSMVAQIATSDVAVFTNHLIELEQILETMGWVLRMRASAVIEH